MSIQRSRIRKFTSYLLSDKAYWYWATVSATAFTALIVLFPTPEGIDLLIYVRYILGLIYVLWFPGYSVVKLALPRGELKSVERIALSLAMSLASVSFIGFLLTYTPWEIRLLPVTLTILALTITCSTAAVLREYLSRSA